MKHTFENMRKISQNEYKYHTVDHIEKITTEDEMTGKSIIEKQEHLCGTLGLYGTQSQVNLAVDVLEELKNLKKQNKLYRDLLERIDYLLEKAGEADENVYDLISYVRTLIGLEGEE